MARKRAHWSATAPYAYDLCIYPRSIWFMEGYSDGIRPERMTIFLRKNFLQLGPVCDLVPVKCESFLDATQSGTVPKDGKITMFLRKTAKIFLRASRFKKNSLNFPAGEPLQEKQLKFSWGRAASGYLPKKCASLFFCCIFPNKFSLNSSRLAPSLLPSQLGGEGGSSPISPRPSPSAGEGVDWRGGSWPPMIPTL